MTKGGFQFDLCGRNAYLEARGIKPPRLTKTGTTIAGLIFKVLRVSGPYFSECIPHHVCQAPVTETFLRECVVSSLSLNTGWSRPGSRHTVDIGYHSRRQELRKDTLYSTQHLLLWRWDSSRH